MLSYSEFKRKTLYFDDIEEFLKTEEILLSLNKVKNRNIAVIVNPISGKRRGQNYANTILKPMLNFAGIKYMFFETDSPSYIENWMAQYNDKKFPFTDIISVGGDGLFSQIINSIENSPNKTEFLKVSIGLLPCGTQNAICCDLGGK